MSDKPVRVDQTTEYIGGYHDALKDQERSKAIQDRIAAEEAAGVVKTPNGVWRMSEHGVPITVTQPDDPAFFLLKDGHSTTPVVHRTTCYICEDPEFAQMGLPLCRPCPKCTGDGDEPKGHIAADDCECDVCGYDEQEAWDQEQEKKPPS